MVLGDDQLECFDFNNLPGVAVYVGDEYEGHLSDYELTVRYPRGAERPALPPKQRLKNDPNSQSASLPV